MTQSMGGGGWGGICKFELLKKLGTNQQYTRIYVPKMPKSEIRALCLNDKIHELGITISSFTGGREMNRCYRHSVHQPFFVNCPLFYTWTAQGIIQLLTSRLGGGQRAYSHLYAMRVVNTITGDIHFLHQDTTMYQVIVQDTVMYRIQPCTRWKDRIQSWTRW